MNHISEVEHLIEAFCEQKFVRAGLINERYAHLWREIGDYLMSGGKRLRPRLVMMAYDAYGGEKPKETLHVAAAWELLHACLLVHDDIIDRDQTRHGRPNIAGRYEELYGKTNNRPDDYPHYALSVALLGGDLLLMGAYEIISQAPLASEEKLLASSYLNDAIFEVAGGELIDTDSVLYEISDTDPFSVAIHKTASYSLQLPLLCGASLAGVSENELDKLRQIGLHAGFAYQMRDDILGMYGDTEKTGKSNRSDIFEKKRTVLLQEALKNLPESKIKRLSALYSPEHIVIPDEAEEIYSLFEMSGAKVSVDEMINNETIKAAEIITTLDVSDHDKSKINELIFSLTKRTH